MPTSHTKIHIIGGNNSNRIGANCQILEHQNETGVLTRVMFDLGALLLEDNHQDSFLVPDVVKYLGYNQPKSMVNQLLKHHHFSQGGQKYPQIDALFLTHMHEDHIGGIKNLLKAGFILPDIYASKETLVVLGRILIEEGVQELPSMYPIGNREIQVSKDVIITPFPVSHTTVGTLGYHILTKFNNQPESGILHFGDFNLSDTIIPHSYDTNKFKQFLNNRYITHIMCDSTSSGNKEKQPLTFKESTANWQSLMQNTSKRIVSSVISRSTQNLAPIILAAKQTGRTVFIDGYAQRLVYEELQKIGVLDAFKETVYQHEDISKADLPAFLAKYKKEKQVIIFSGAFAEGFENTENNISGLARVAKGKHKSFLLDSSSLVVLSQRAIPVTNIHQNMCAMAEELAQRNNGQLIQNKTSSDLSIGNYPMMALQRTGHATYFEITALINLIKANRLNINDKLTVIPLHGDEKQLNNTYECAKKTNTMASIAFNGEEIDLSAPQDTIKTSVQPQQWLCFKTAGDCNPNNMPITLVEEVIQNGSVSYKTICFLNGKGTYTPLHRNKTQLIQAMRAMLDRQNIR